MLYVGTIVMTCSLIKNWSLCKILVFFCSLNHIAMIVIHLILTNYENASWSNGRHVIVPGEATAVHLLPVVIELVDIAEVVVRLNNDNVDTENIAVYWLG